MTVESDPQAIKSRKGPASKAFGIVTDLSGEVGVRVGALVVAALAGVSWTWLSGFATERVSVPGWLVVLLGVALVAWGVATAVFAFEVRRVRKRPRPHERLLGEISGLVHQLSGRQSGLAASIEIGESYKALVDKTLKAGVISKAPIGGLPEPDPDRQGYTNKTYGNLLVGLTEMQAALDSDGRHQ